MPLRRRETITFEQVPDFLEELSEAIRDMEEEIIWMLQRDARRTAKRLATQLMPSQGGSYRRSIKSRVQRNTDRVIEHELYSDHQWAMAIEYGTEPHDIPMGGVPGSKKLKWTQQLPGNTGKSTPLGTKYETGEWSASVVKHPGARAFRIFRTTTMILKRNLKRIIDDAWNKEVVN